MKKLLLLILILAGLGYWYVRKHGFSARAEPLAVEKAVAERLFLSPHTVRTHMQNVLGKLGVHSTLAAVALARRAGVGPVDLAGEIVERGGQLA